jgi:hypothetical protein
MVAMKSLRAGKYFAFAFLFGQYFRRRAFAGFSCLFL